MVRRDLVQDTRSAEEEQRRPDRATGPFWRANRVTLVAAALAAGLAAAVYIAFPQQRGVESLWAFLAALTPFVAAAVAIAWLDLPWAERLRLQLILPPVCFLVFFCYFVPKIFYYAGITGDFDRLYFTVLMLVPFITLALVLSLRLGGARRSTVLRLAGALLLLHLSGIEDLAFLTVNDLSGTDFSPIPEVWTWVDHMAVRLGHYPTRNEAYVFITVHVVAAVLVLALPGRLFRALGAPWRRGREEEPS